MISDGGDDLSAAVARRRRGVDAIAGLSLLIAFIYRFQAGSDAWFFADDFSLTARHLNLDGLFEPYNGHLLTTGVALYQGVLHLGGGMTSFTPLRTTGLIVAFALPVSAYLVGRRRVSPVLALAVATLLTWTIPPSYLSMQFAFLSVLTIAVVLAWLLPRSGRRSDTAVGVLVAFGLLTSSVGIVVAATVLIHTAWSGANRRRWVAAALPTAAWALWWTLVGRNAPTLGEPVDLGEAFRLVVEGMEHAARTLAFGNRVGGLLVAAALLLHFVARLRSGRAAASTVAWTVGAVGWWAALIIGRGALVSPEEFRYRLVGAVFLLLGLLPEARIALPKAIRDLMDERTSPVWASVACAAVVTLAVSVVSHGAFEDARRSEAAFARIDRQQTAVISLDPPVLEPGTELPIWMGYETVDDVRQLQQRWDLPAPSTPRAVDQVLAAELLSPDVRATGGSCDDSRPSILTTPPDSRVTVRTPPGVSRPAIVSIRRFGDAPVRAGDVSPGRDATFTLLGSLADTPWVIQVEGGCFIP